MISRDRRHLPHLATTFLIWQPPSSFGRSSGWRTASTSSRCRWTSGSRRSRCTRTCCARRSVVVVAVVVVAVVVVAVVVVARAGLGMGPRARVPFTPPLTPPCACHSHLPSHRHPRRGATRSLLLRAIHTACHSHHAASPSAQLKAVEDERHTAAKELSDRLLKVGRQSVSLCRPLTRGIGPTRSVRQVFTNPYHGASAHELASITLQG